MRSPGVSGSGRGPSCGVWGLAPAGEGRTPPGRCCRRPSPPAPQPHLPAGGSLGVGVCSPREGGGGCTPVLLTSCPLGEPQHGEPLQREHHGIFSLTREPILPCLTVAPRVAVPPGRPAHGVLCFRTTAPRKLTAMWRMPCPRFRRLCRSFQAASYSGGSTLGPPTLPRSVPPNPAPLRTPDPWPGQTPQPFPGPVSTPPRTLLPQSEPPRAPRPPGAPVEPRPRPGLPGAKAVLRQHVVCVCCRAPDTR